MFFFFFFQAEDGIRDLTVTGVQTCALPIYVLDLLRDLVLIRLEHLELLEAFHRVLEFAEQLVLRAQRQGCSLLSHLHRRDAPFQSTQLRTDIGVAGAAELPFHFDQGFRLRLELVPLLTVLAGLPGERGPAVLESAELRADLPLRLVDEIALLTEERGLLVQGVALFQETLELDLRLIEFRKGLFPDHLVPPRRMECSD